MKINKVFTYSIAAFLLLAVGCKKDKFEEIAGVCPLVISTNPTDLATNVPVSQTITATFNEAMNPETINSSSFTINGGTQISGTVSYDETNATASFTPNTKLTPNTAYTARIAPSVRDLMGSALQTEYVWTFSTGDTLKPLVISTDPPDNATGVPLNKTVTATFNMAMDSASINDTTFTLKNGATIIAGTVTYSGTTAYFNPVSNLATNTVYTATITTGAKNKAGTPMASNYTWTFSTGTTVAPAVTSTDPADKATGVFLNKTITATFNMSMNPATINATTFTLKNGAVAVAGVVTYSGNTAAFNPTNPLAAGTTYTATISTGAENTTGEKMANNYVWTFTSGTVVAPVVVSTDPPNNATGVPLNKIVTATFSMAMDPATLNTTTFTLKNGATPVAGTVSYSATTASFTPTGNLLPGTTYTANITTGAKNPAGTPLANNYEWTFTTLPAPVPQVISTDPANNATGVALNKTVMATFNMAMDPSTINSSTFTLKNGATSVAGSVSYMGNTASFNPSANLLSGTTYTATITTGAKNLAGTPMASNYVWTFTTVPHLGPPVVDLKSAARFGILAGVGVTNNAGFSVINNMDVGISPGVRASVTGFPPATIINGAMYASDDIAPPGVAAMLTQAKQELTDAYLFAEAATNPAPVSVSGDLGGTTLAPGIYKSNSTLMIQSGNLTLDAQGDQNATWIFQIASGFTTVGGAGGSVILINGAQAKNIFWQTGSSATIGDLTVFQGNILALTSITMNSGATATGRMLVQNGSVVLTNTNIINKP